VRWDRNYSSSNIEDHRGDSGGAGLFDGGGGGGGGLFLIIRLLSMFGWKGLLVGLVIAGAVTAGGHCSNVGTTHHAVTSSPQETEMIHRIGYVFDDVQNTWKAQMPNYENTHLVLFRNRYPSACGTATSAVGPFYCPIDHKVYIDLAFYDELARQFGAPGEFAQAYVIAHELGHHVQNQRHLLGGGAAESVHVELQADCLAGAWANDANKRGIIEPGDIAQALNAAAQIGDDTLQKKATGHVQPEKFTHGTSAQRKASFEKGYEGGAPACL
jgi:uncharacterized protein